MLVGTETADDAAVYRLTDELALVQTVDFFPPIVDEPREYGQIAVANALSDVYAMGGRPLVGMNLVCFPENLDRALLAAILEGGQAKAREAGLLIVGGHTVNDREPKYGLAVTGVVHPGCQVTNAGARPGDALVLTKPLGTGILTTAAKHGTVSSSSVRPAVRSMVQLNAAASEAMMCVGVHACTDVTGFGLLGHLLTMVDGSGVSARLFRSAVPVLAEAVELAEEGIAPGGTLRTLEWLNGRVAWGDGIGEGDRLLLSDAQTSGGLLMAVPPERLERLMAELEGRGVEGVGVIGRADEPGGLPITVTG